MSERASTFSESWYPVATAEDLAPRAIHRTQLLGHELVLWRADDGFVNTWQNRCLHRGVRLSIGSCDGAELVCRYHAWRYSNRSGGCTYVPAHPEDSPPRTVKNATFPTVERYGLAWAALDSPPDVAGVPVVDALEGETLGLRNLPIKAPGDVVLARLFEHRFLPSARLDAELADANVTATSGGGFVTLTSAVDDQTSTAVFFVQPLEGGHSVVRPVLGEAPGNPIEVLRHHAYQLNRLKRTVEADRASLPPDAPSPGAETPVTFAVEHSSQPNGLTEVTVTQKHSTAQNIATFELVANDGHSLSTAMPGDHIDVHLPNDLVRQYSLTNPPGQADRFRIGVKRDADSRGGSSYLHESIQVGDTLAISGPHSGFPLRRTFPNTIFIAGGIGITPLLSMAHALSSMELPFGLHYFAASAQDVAFGAELEAFGDAVHLWLGLSPDATGDAIRNLLAEPNPDTQIYACGPPPMLNAIRSIATEAGWPEDAVRFEYFKNTTEIDDSSSFVVELARSAKTVEVPEGTTILEALQANNIPIESSCEQGACGTCLATVIDGEPLHQDVYLSATERAAGELILTCVSRASSDRLVLDL